MSRTEVPGVRQAQRHSPSTDRGRAIAAFVRPPVWSGMGCAPSHLSEPRKRDGWEVEGPAALERVSKMRFVTGHDFGRAEKEAGIARGFNPCGIRARQPRLFLKHALQKQRRHRKWNRAQQLDEPAPFSSARENAAGFRRRFSRFSKTRISCFPWLQSSFHRTICARRTSTPGRIRRSAHG